MSDTQPCPVIVAEVVLFEEHVDLNWVNPLRWPPILVVTLGAVRSLGRRALEVMVAEATVDCYNDSECVTGFYTMLDEHLAVPFQTTVLGVEVTVTKVDLTGDEQIVAVCARGRARQRIPVLDLPLPTPPPDGAEWIEAYRAWLR